MTLSLFNQIGPRLLRYGISARYALAGGILKEQQFLDAVCLIPISKKIIELDIREEVANGRDSIQVLDDYIRPALVPNNRWSDVRRWQFHVRVLQWLRSQYLIHRYHTILKPPELPTSKYLIETLEMQDWSITKNRALARLDMQKLVEGLGGDFLQFRGGCVSISHLKDDTNLSHLSLGQILELAGCHVLQCGPFNALCEKLNVNQVWTREYVARLSHYLAKRSKQETVVLEVGAGDGLLSQHLRKALGREDHIQVVAVDDGSWGIQHKGPVEKLSTESALQKYQNQNLIVLCSWMPNGEDWSYLFRKYNVIEYILIGECDDGQCGDNWKTWGNDKYLYGDLHESQDIQDGEKAKKDDSTDSVPSTRNESASSDESQRVAPYIVDGYIRKELVSLAKFQFSRFDCRTSKFGRTTSFRKQ